jgi:hypothetical protein
MLTERTENIDPITIACQTWLFLLRHEIRSTGLQIAYLKHHNLRSNKPIVTPGGPVVSVTSFGERLQTVYLALESIACGFVLPSRLILWISKEEAPCCEMPCLRRLSERGLEIRLCDDLGPHKKYYPYLSLILGETFDSNLITADDDVVYSRWWLSGFVNKNREDPNTILCYRAHRMQMTGSAISRYATWNPCRTTRASFLNFATGASGCLYPAPFLGDLKRAGSGFMELCPRADDVWLHVNAVRARYKIKQIFRRPLRFPSIPGTQTGALFETNHLSGQNDVQIANTYGREDVEILIAENRADRSAC